MVGPRDGSFIERIGMVVDLPYLEDYPLFYRVRNEIMDYRLAFNELTQQVEELLRVFEATRLENDALRRQLLEVDQARTHLLEKNKRVVAQINDMIVRIKEHIPAQGCSYDV